MDVAPSKTKETLKHLRMYMKYKITIRAYNSKGESPPSDPIYAQTLSGSTCFHFHIRIHNCE